jgi:DivIVA domain-containing protein
MTNLPPADWYQDPAGSGQLRYFDGRDWTDFFHPMPSESPRRAEAPAGGGLTADHVVNVAFSKPPLGKRGYHEDQVDAFLDRVERTLRNPHAPGGLTADEVHGFAFSKPPIGKRGYNEDEVDAFLDLVEATLRRR